MPVQIQTKDKEQAVNAAMSDIRMVGRHFGREEMLRLVSGPCGYMPGSCYKVAILAMRYELGIELHVDGDAESHAEFLGRSGRHRVRQSRRRGVVVG